MKKITTLLFVTLLGLSACKGNANKGIEIKGSDTLLELVQAQAEQFVKKSDVAVNVTGGGSGVGIASILNNTTDIANSSRDIKDKEKKQAEAAGSKIVEIKLAIDAIAVIVNPNNPVKSLNMEQLGAIYRGEIKNWKEVGGKDAAISLYGRQNSSGTFVFFREHVLKDKDYSAEMKRMAGNAQIVAGIKTDEAGIGYVGIGYVSAPNLGVNILGVDGPKGLVFPTDKEKVLSGDYSVSRFLFQYVDKAKITGNVQKFLQFELSAEGQKIVEETGFYPLGAEKAKNVNPEVF